MMDCEEHQNGRKRDQKYSEGGVYQLRFGIPAEVENDECTNEEEEPEGRICQDELEIPIRYGGTVFTSISSRIRD